MCGNYSREETIQGRKLYEEIRYSKIFFSFHTTIFKILLQTENKGTFSCSRLINSTCSTLINFLSFAQLSLISKKMSALTLSLPFSKIECAPDHHSFIKSALFFQSFVFLKSPMILCVINVGI